MMDKKIHFLFGTLTVAFSLIFLAIDHSFGAGLAIFFATSSVGALYEVQQKIRGEGEPSIADAVATAAPGAIYFLFFLLK
jgi:hypothetical protein